ncbi:hypothetical protein JB92DRAFT_3125394 [Gautieria morchelliformis]|nr:hypothetical protein JB92DRAFT_3125394 [Gautieria morchelliformis]
MFLYHATHCPHPILWPHAPPTPPNILNTLINPVQDHITSTIPTIPGQETRDASKPSDMSKPSSDALKTPGTAILPLSVVYNTTNVRTPVKTMSKRKPHEEVTTIDLDKLLCAIIDADPYLVPCIEVGDHWKHAARLIQEGGFCQGHNVDTLRNKVTSLLAWVEYQVIPIFPFTPPSLCLLCSPFAGFTE